MSDPTPAKPAAPKPPAPEPTAPKPPATAPAEFSAADRKLKRRWQLIATLLLLAAAGATIGSAQLTWVVVYAESAQTAAANFYVDGSDWSPWLVPVGVLYLAAIGALFALHGGLLRVAAVVIAIAGGVSILPAVSLIQDGGDTMYAVEAIDVPATFERFVLMPDRWPAYLLIAGAVCAIVAGYAMLRSARGPGMSSKYSSPAARRAQLEAQVFAERERRLAAQTRGDGASGADPTTTGTRAGTNAAGTRAAGSDEAETKVNERVLWDSLDHGLDPTDDEGTRG